MANFYFDDLDDDDLEEEVFTKEESEDFFVDMHSFVDDMDEVENEMKDFDDEESDIGL